VTLQYSCRSSDIFNLQGCPLPLPLPSSQCSCSSHSCLLLLPRNFQMLNVQLPSYARVHLLNRLSDTATYDPNNLPPTTEQGQTGTNQCGTGSNQTSQCQNIYVNSLRDFCLWGSARSPRTCSVLTGLILYSPPEPNSAVGNVEEIVVAYCTSPGRGTRLFPAGTILQAHLLV